MAFLGRPGLFVLTLLFAAWTGMAAAETVRVHKTPWCGCCIKWVEHLKAEGFAVEVHEHEDLDPVAARLGVPDALRSCHTAEVAGYAIEGHVPAADIRRLLAEKPEGAAGLSVPGMPVGSPGMEQGDAKEPFVSVLFTREGDMRIYARH